MENLWRSCLDLLVDPGNVIRLDRKFWTVEGSEFRVFHEVELGSISSENRYRGIAVENLETQAPDEEVQTDVDVGVKQFWNQSKQHGGSPWSSSVRWFGGYPSAARHRRGLTVGDRRNSTRLIVAAVRNKKTQPVTIL